MVADPVLVTVFTVSMAMSQARSLRLAMNLVPSQLWMTFLTALASSRSILVATVSFRMTAPSLWACL